MDQKNPVFEFAAVASCPLSKRRSKGVRRRDDDGDFDGDEEELITDNEENPNRSSTVSINPDFCGEDAETGGSVELEQEVSAVPVLTKTPTAGGRGRARGISQKLGMVMFQQQIRGARVPLFRPLCPDLILLKD